MNIFQYRKNLEKYGDLDFVVGKKYCHIMYKGVSLMQCDRQKNDYYSFSKEDEKMLLQEMKYRNELLDFWKIVSIIRFPIRSYKRCLKGYDLI